MPPLRLEIACVLIGVYGALVGSSLWRSARPPSARRLASEMGRAKGALPGARHHGGRLDIPIPKHASHSCAYDANVESMMVWETHYRPVIGDTDAELHTRRPARLLVVGAQLPDDVHLAGEVRHSSPDVDLPMGVYIF
jgi:hypothetical protein